MRVSGHSQAVSGLLSLLCFVQFVVDFVFLCSCFLLDVFLGRGMFVFEILLFNEIFLRTFIDWLIFSKLNFLLIFFEIIVFYIYILIFFLQSVITDGTVRNVNELHSAFGRDYFAATQERSFSALAPTLSTNLILLNIFSTKTLHYNHFRKSGIDSTLKYLWQTGGTVTAVKEN